MVCLKVWMEYFFDSPDGRFGAKISANYEYSRSIPSRKECKKFLSVLQQRNALSVSVQLQASS